MKFTSGFLQDLENVSKPIMMTAVMFSRVEQLTSLRNDKIFFVFLFTNVEKSFM